MTTMQARHVAASRGRSHKKSEIVLCTEEETSDNTIAIAKHEVATRALLLMVNDGQKVPTVFGGFSAAGQPWCGGSLGVEAPCGFRRDRISLCTRLTTA